MDTIENLIIAIVKPLISQPDVLNYPESKILQSLWNIISILIKLTLDVLSVVRSYYSAIRTIVYSVPTEDKSSHRH